MKQIDDLLKTSVPPLPELPDDFSEQVLQRIVTEEVQILDSGGLNRFRLGLGLITMLSAIVLFSYNSYELRMNGSLELLFFGTRYLIDFLGYLPWDLIVPSFLLAGFSSWMISRSRLFQKGVAVTAIFTFLATGLGGAAMAAVGLNERIEQGITQRQDSWPWLRLFHHERAKRFISHPHFRMGKVVEVKGQTAFVLTPHGESLRIELPVNSTVEAGQILRMSGSGDQTVFSVQRVHVCNPNRVMRYFTGTKDPEQMMRPCCRNHGMMN